MSNHLKFSRRALLGTMAAAMAALATGARPSVAQLVERIKLNHGEREKLNRRMIANW